MPPEVAARRREWAALEEALQQRLDPIDWATYEPYLAANVAAYLQSTETLLGSLLQLARPPAPEVLGQKILNSSHFSTCDTANDPEMNSGSKLSAGFSCT